MICEECSTPDSQGRYGFEGDPPEEATFLVTIVGPPDAAEHNAAQVLCGDHATVAVEAYVGYGWAVHADLLPAPAGMSRLRYAIREADRRWVSSLIGGSSNAPSGG